MRHSSLLLVLLPALCYGAALPTLYQGLDLSTIVLDRVKEQVFFLRTSITKLQQGISNLKNSQINEYDIASLEPQMAILAPKLAKVAAAPSLLDGLNAMETATLLARLASLRKLLPSDTREFNMKFQREGAYSIISQAIVEINDIVYALGF